MDCIITVLLLYYYCIITVLYMEKHRIINVRTQYMPQ
jgi:hypothetical protein